MPSSSSRGYRRHNSGCPAWSVTVAIMSWFMSRSAPTLFPCGIPCSFARAISRSNRGRDPAPGPAPAGGH